MKYYPLILLIFSFTCGFGQPDTPDTKNNHTIRLYTEPGYTAVRHEIVDKDRYEGLIIPLGIEWEKQTLKKNRKLYASFSTGYYIRLFRIYGGRSQGRRYPPGRFSGSMGNY